YVKAWVYDKTGAQSDFGETSAQWDTLNPVWQEDIVKARAGQKIKIAVWDKELKYGDLSGEELSSLTAAMMGHGGVIDRIGWVTRVIQVATPNGGAKLASLAVNLLQVPKAQAPFVASLSPSHREAVMKTRQDKAIPATIDFVAVVACPANQKGDGTLNRACQWT